MTATVSVVIVSYNTREFLRACLGSLMTSEPWCFADSALRNATAKLVIEVIVVDNGSVDGSVAMVSDEFPWVRVIANPANEGFATANNQGIAIAGGDYVLLLNPDTEVTPGAIPAMVAYMTEHGDVGALGCQLLNPDLSLQPSGRDFPRLGGVCRELMPLPAPLRRLTRSRTERRDYSLVWEVDEVSGAAMLVRRRALDEVGGLEPTFFFLGEDIDLCWTLRERGWKVVYLPTARVIHHGGRSRARANGETISLLSQRSLYLLFRRHQPRWQATVVKALLVPTTLLKVLKGIALDLATGKRWTTSERLCRLVDEMIWLYRN